MSSPASGSTSSGIGIGQGHPDFGMSGTSVGPVGTVYGGPSPQEARANMRARQAMWDSVKAITEPGYFHKKSRQLYTPMPMNMPINTPKEQVEQIKNLGWIKALPAWDKQIALQELKEEKMKEFEAGHPFSLKGLISNVEGEMDLGMKTGLLGGDQ